MWDPYAEFETATLPNGLTVHAAHWPGRPWEAMGFLIHSGAEHDPVGLEGLAHFVEHMVSKNAGSPKGNIRAFFKDCGGSVGLGETYFSHTSYGFFIPTDVTTLAEAFSIFGRMLFMAKLEKFIERERQVIIGEFRRNHPVKFRFDLDMRKHKALYAGYWLERSVRPLGTIESIGRIKQDDLQSYYDTHYTPANISIVAVGGMTLESLMALLSESPFAMSKKGTRTLPPSPVTDVTPPSETSCVFEFSKYVTMATPMEIGEYGSYAKIPGGYDKRAIQILHSMFDEVLNEEVRERRAWAYAISSSWRNYRHFYEFAINCNALALKAIDEIEEVIEVCIATMVDRDDLFKQAKQRALARNLMIDPNGRGICEGAIDDLSRYQRIISLSEYGKDIEQVTMDDIHNLLRWLRPEMRWTLIGKP